MTPPAHDCDVAVIGGGPGGAVAAYRLARAGRRVTLLEKARGPRFHIGESMLPRTASELAEAGLLERVLRLPHVVKRGATFVAGHGTAPAHHFAFADALDEDPTSTFNIEREPLDETLLVAAEEAGADVRRATAVREVVRLEPDDVVLRTDDGTLHARAVLDASGHGTVIGRARGRRRVLPGHERVAYFDHLRDVRLPEGDPTGYGVIVMFDEGWFWLIPIDATRTSVGVVLPAGFVNEHGIDANRALEWAVRRCPEMQKRCGDSPITGRNHVIANFSYTCRPFGGPGWLLVGDAAAFMDPIFSGGVTLALLSARWAASAVDAALDHPARWPRLARGYDRRLHASMRTLFDMIEKYYQPAYRDLLHHGSGPAQVHRAVNEQLTGRAFPRPRWAVTWRLLLMRVFQMVQQHHELVPRMPRWSAAEAARSVVAASPVAGAHTVGSAG